MFTRRGFLTGLLAAPVVIRTPGILMPIKSFIMPPKKFLTWNRAGGYEDLADVIYRVEPFETPILSAGVGFRFIPKVG